MAIYEESLIKLLSSLGQPHLSLGFESLDPESKKKFVEEISALSPSLLFKQRALLAASPKDPRPFSEWEKCSYVVSKEAKDKGREMLSEGLVACLILAGGKGSRLGSSSPKGTVGVSAIKRKSLFQLLFEKTFYQGLRCGKKLPLVIMTSSSNHQETVEFISSHGWFGLDQNQIYFFTQEDLPLCDKQGNWFLEAPGKLAKGPDGNGHALHLFYQSGLFETLQKQGVANLNVVLIDNALADPFDEGFLGFHALEKSEISIKSIKRESEEELLGVLASDEGALRIIEYTERSKQTQIEPDRISFPLANTGQFCFTFDFIKKLVSAKSEIPWHLSFKKSISFPGFEEKFSWKFEYFLFDVFAYAKQISVLVLPRSVCFSPLKNAEGNSSLVTVASDLLELDRKTYKTLTGEDPLLDVFELSLAFRYPREGENCSPKMTRGSNMLYIESDSL